MTQTYSLKEYHRPKLSVPRHEEKVLLHSCCAPCAGEIMLALQESEVNTVLYFYNPNIHPQNEYEIRKNENKRYADKLKMPFIDADYDKDNWFQRIKGLENEAERGPRCTACFDMRFEKTALYAHENNFKVFSSTLGISRWKDMNQINECGVRSASRYDQLEYWTFNWRKKGGSQRMIELAKEEKFYQQEYCGCVYSLRDTNKWRKERGGKKIERGTLFYS